MTGSWKRNSGFAVLNVCDGIADDRCFRYFGKPGSAFDFAASDMGRLREKARELEEQQKGMKKKVNPKVLNMLERYVRFSRSACGVTQSFQSQRGEA